MLAATPPAALLALAPDGAGNGGALSGTDPNAEPEPEATAEAEPDTASEGEEAAANQRGAEPTVADPPGAP